MFSFIKHVLNFFFPAANLVYGPPAPVRMTQDQIETSAFSQARSDLIAREGYATTAYYDSKGILTVGIGHRVLTTDNIRAGDKISDTRVSNLFNNDIATAFTAAKSQAQELGKYTPDMIAALISVNFQLGTGWRSKFPNTWSSLKAGNARDAISRLQASDWNKTTPQRVADFIDTIQSQYA